MFGMHNVLNSLTTFAAGHDAGIKADKIVDALARFTGVKRRFTTTGIVNNVTVIDDYGHHPVEIQAVLKAASEAVQGKGGGRVIAVVQPHRFTRLAGLFDQFCSSCLMADEVIIADVYAAGEAPIPGVTRDALISCMKKAGQEHVHALDAPEDLPALVHSMAQPGDFVVCMGAGSITQWAASLPRALEQLYGTGPKKANGK
jgi:UDP-N-acetylmuramate--alanine ligase